MQKPQNIVIIVYLKVLNKNINRGFCCKMWMFLTCLTKSRHLTGLLKRTPVWFRYVNTAVGARPASGVSCPVSSGVKGSFPAPDVPGSRRTVVFGLSCGLLPLGVLWGLPPPPLWAAYFAVWKLLLDPHCPQHKIHSPSCGRKILLTSLASTHTASPRAVVQLHKALALSPAPEALLGCFHWAWMPSRPSEPTSKIMSSLEASPSSAEGLTSLCSCPHVHTYCWETYPAHRL